MVVFQKRREKWSRGPHSVAADRPIPPPLVKSAGLGPDGDAPLVLIRGGGERDAGGGETKSLSRARLKKDA
jgi:hypothetical protein